MSLGRARLDGESLYGEPLFSLLGEVAAGFRGRDMVSEKAFFYRKCVLLTRMLVCFSSQRFRRETSLQFGALYGDPQNRRQHSVDTAASERC